MRRTAVARTGHEAITYLLDVATLTVNGAVLELIAGDRLDLGLAKSGPMLAGVEARTPDGRPVGRLPRETAVRVAPLLAAGRRLAATVTALLPRPTGGPPRIQLAIGRANRVT